MPSIKLRGVKNFILKGVDLDINDGELLCVLGPNGAGKTTLLKVIAGLTKYEGSVFFNETPVDDFPPEKRNVGYVPQNLALFPHMTVEENVAYGLKVRGLPKVIIKERVNEMLELLELNHLRNRYPKTLSGGEKQKVAIARALAVRPSILLLDEPFTNIQPGMKRQLIYEIKKLHSKIGMTTLYVTHEVGEVEEFNSRVAVLYNGSLIGVGKLSEVINVISEVLQELNVIRCVSTSESLEGLARVRCGDLLITALTENPVKVGEELFLAIPPDKIALYREQPYVKVNTFKAEVVNSNTERCEVVISLGGFKLKAYNPGYISLKEGDYVYVELPIKYIKMVM